MGRYVGMMKMKITMLFIVLFSTGRLLMANVSCAPIERALAVVSIAYKIPY
jgi:hypothetical protein